MLYKMLFLTFFNLISLNEIFKTFALSIDKIIPKEKLFFVYYLRFSIEIILCL